VAENSLDMKIVRFRESLAADFARLNYEWIEKAYSVEKHDRELLDDPAEQIIARGGQIFFAVAGEAVLGTVAMIEIDADSFELAKMAVSPDHRGRGIGDMLMTACIEYARESGKRWILLESNTKQVAAIGLYRKFGFLETSLDPDSYYQRANIRMELDVDG
jgi:ribosomal protein S18 acetylase RimI-like enzyme